MRQLMAAAGVLALTLLPAAAQAGEFSVFCSYKNENLQKCASAISDVVTDKFIARFPATKYQIFIHSNVHSYTNGGFAAYAVAGVISRGSWDFPARYYSNTNIDGTDKRYTSVQLAEHELQIYRAAVRSLMEACEVSPDCDVYLPRAGK